LKICTKGMTASAPFSCVSSLLIIHPSLFQTSIADLTDRAAVLPLSCLSWTWISLLRCQPLMGLAELLLEPQDSVVCIRSWGSFIWEAQAKDLAGREYSGGRHTASILLKVVAELPAAALNWVCSSATASIEK
jgi:hypothetical protein